jgi:hypothetical protein
MFDVMPSPADDEDDARIERHEAEIVSTLEAIAGAIAAGRLPPDDAFAWARIAACEVEALPRQAAVSINVVCMR